jgi:cell division protein FtsW
MEKVQYDKTLILTVTLMVIFGLIMVFSASSVVSFKELGNEFYFFKKQFIFSLLGFGVLFLMMKTDYHVITKYVYPILLGSILLLIFVLIPGIGREVNGARRWIGILGLSFQPAELAKLALVIYLAFSFTKKDDKIKTLKIGFIPHMILLLVVAALIMLQPDFGAAVTVGVLVFIMLFIAGTPLYYILTALLLAAPFLYIAVIKVEYRLQRITAFLNPWEDPQKTGYHIIQSFLAFGSGGVAGTGLGAGTQKLFYIPYAYSDFIFAVIGEELGFIGAILVIFGFLIFAVRGMKTAQRAPDPFGMYLAFGITALITVEAILNIGVVTGIFPTKGMTLPFISYGGSSLLVSMTAAGILINISGQRRET